MLHGPDGAVETVVDYQAVRLGRRREGRKHLRCAGRSSVTCKFACEFFALGGLARRSWSEGVATEAQLATGASSATQAFALG